MEYQKRDYYFINDGYGRYNTDVPLHIISVGYYYRIGHGIAQRINSYYRLQLTVFNPNPDNEEAVLKECQFALYEPNVPYRFNEGKGYRTGYYWAHFSGFYVKTLVQECGIEPGKIYTLREEQSRTLQRDFDSLLREQHLQQSNYQNMGAFLLAQILVKVGRFVSDAAPQNRLRMQLEEPVVYINDHYTDKLSISKLAAMANLSDRRFRQLFREAYGVSPSEFILTLRLNYACQLLRDSGQSVAEIAAACGYEDSLYFSRLFHKKVGIAPLRYRKEQTSAQQSDDDFRADGQG